MKNQVLTILWMSLNGWMNRPDYFSRDAFLFIGDLAYQAQTDEDGLAKAFGDWMPDDMYEISVAMHNGDPKADGLWEFLKAKDASGIPLMCDLSKFDKYEATR